MQRIILIIIAIFTSQVAVSQNFETYLEDPNDAPREHHIDVQKMVVNVHFDTKKGIVHGVVTHTVKPLRDNVDTLFFDAPSIEINSVKIKTAQKKSELEDVPFRTNDAGLILDKQLKTGQEYSIVIDYKATPKRGIYFIGWNVDGVTDKRNQTRKQIWTQGQGIDNRHWIPMYDNMNDKFITETIVTFDEKYNVLSNGELVSKKKADNNQLVWHYKMPHPHAGYLLMLAIDEYAVKETKTSTGTPVQFWYYPEHEDKLEYTSMYTERIIEFLERETGYKYPWGTYSQVMVQDFLYGAMENTSATIFGDFFLSDGYSFNDRNYIGVNAHELTHQWFGDLVTARSSAGTWLQESFATYYAKLFIGEVYGEDEYKMQHRAEVRRALAASLRDNYPVGHSQGGTSRVYPKGSTVLHMMRYVLGDEEYLRVIDAYLDEYAFQNVESNDLYQVVQDELGVTLDWFFDQWIYRGGEPHYRVKYTATGYNTEIIVEQIQEQTPTVGLFKMPINIAVFYEDGSKDQGQFWIEDQTEIIRIENKLNKSVACVVFDVNEEITKSMTFKRSEKELLNQIKFAENMVDRLEAIESLGEITGDVRKALHEAYSDNSFYGIRAEIVRKLASDQESTDFLQKVLPKADLRVKRAYLGAIERVDDQMRGVVEGSLSDSSYQNIGMALTLLSRSYPDEQAKFLEQTKEIYGRAFEIRIPWCVYQVVNGEKSFVEEIVNYSSEKYEFRTRINAFEGLIATNHLDEQAVLNLFNAATSLNGRLAAPARSTLDQFGDQEQYARLIDRVAYSEKVDEETRKELKKRGVIH